MSLSTTRYSVARNAREAEAERYLCGNSIFANRFSVKWIFNNVLLLKHLQVRSVIGTKVVLPPGSLEVDLTVGCCLLGEALKVCSSDMLQCERKAQWLLREMSGEALFKELVYDIFCNVKFSLIKKIAKNCLLLSRADRCAVFILEGTGGEQKLVCRATDATRKQYRKECPKVGLECSIGFGMVGHVVETGRTANIEVGPAHTAFNGEVDVVSGCDPIICVPITAPSGQVLGTAQLSGRDLGDNDGVFCKKDEEILETYLSFAGIAMVNSGKYDEILTKTKQLEALLTLSKGVLQDVNSLENTMNKVLLETYQLIPCSVCRYLIIDESTVVGTSKSVVFSHMFEMTHKKQPQQKTDSEMEDMAAEVGDLKAAIKVASTGESCVIKSPIEARDDERFSALYMPVFGMKGLCIGVVQFINKLTTKDFTSTDVECFKVFSTFCGQAIHNALSYAKLNKTKTHYQLALNALCENEWKDEVDAELQQVMAIDVPSFARESINTFHFDHLYCNDRASVLAIAEFFHTCELTKKFSIRKKDLLRWLLTVMREYQAFNYHNWRHAFNVVHTLYVVLTTGEVGCWMTDLEKLALFIAAVCHDIAWHAPKTPLSDALDTPLSGMTHNVIAELYSSSSKDNLSFKACIKTLNSMPESKRILRHLTGKEYQEVLGMIEDGIRSTDLAVYAERKDYFMELVADKSFDWFSEPHKKVLRSTMMVACDLSAITKPWKIHKRMRTQIGMDYFEYKVLPENPTVHNTYTTMNEWIDKLNMDQLHIDFVIDFCNGLYENLAKLHGGFQPLYHGMLKNHGRWVQLIDEREVAIYQRVEDQKALDLLKYGLEAQQDAAEQEAARRAEQLKQQQRFEDMMFPLDASDQEFEEEEASAPDNDPGEEKAVMEEPACTQDEEDPKADSGIVLGSNARLREVPLPEKEASAKSKTKKQKGKKKKGRGTKVLRILSAPMRAVRKLLKR